MMPAGHHVNSQTGLDWYRLISALLFVFSLVLIVWPFARSMGVWTPLLVVALVLGGMTGWLITMRDRSVREAAPSSGTGEVDQETVFPGTATVGTSTSGYVPYKAPAPLPRSEYRSTGRGVSGSPGPFRTRPVPSPDFGVTEPPVFESGTAAGRSPWRLPTRQAQSGIAADAARLGDLEVRAASVIGPGHRCEEPATARQDAYALMPTNSGSHLIVAVADGVSSSTSSDLGARVAVSAAVRILHRELEVSPEPHRLAADALFTKVAGEMVGTGRSRDLDARALCSVLIVAVVPTVAQYNGLRRVWTAQVGDVSLWLHGRGGWRQQTGRAKTGLDRNKVEAVLPFNPDQAVSGFVDVQSGEGVAVMTDGMADTLSDVVAAKPYFADRWARPPHLARFVFDLCFDAPGQKDDRTAVVVWCGRNI